MKRVLIGTIGLLAATSGASAADLPARHCSEARPCQISFLAGQQPVKRELLTRGDVESYIWINRKAPICDLAPHGFNCYAAGTLVRVTTDGMIRAVRLAPHRVRVTFRYWKS